MSSTYGELAEGIEYGTIPRASADVTLRGRFDIHLSRIGDVRQQCELSSSKRIQSGSMVPALISALRYRRNASEPVQRGGILLE